MLPYRTPKPKAKVPPIWYGVGVYQIFFRKIGFELMTSSLRRHIHIIKNDVVFCVDVTGGSNFVRNFFLIPNHKMLMSQVTSKNVLKRHLS